MKQFGRVLMSGVLLAGMTMPVVASAQAGYGRPYPGQYASTYYGGGDRGYNTYGSGYNGSGYNGSGYGNGYQNDAYYGGGYGNGGYYRNRGRGIGPGQGAAIGGIAGVVLGGLLGGGRGALIGGVAGAGVGAVAGSANQNSRRYGNGYGGYGYRR